MDDLIALLEEMGAENVQYLEKDGDDDQLSFVLHGKHATIWGVHYNDGTGGLAGDVVL